MKLKLLFLFSFLAWLSPRGVVTAANEEVVAANDALSAVTFSVMDGGSLRVPFGNYPVTVKLQPEDAKKARACGHQVSKEGHAIAMQVIDAQAANDMSASLTGFLQRLVTGFKAVALYSGHPYHPDPEKAKNFTDKRAYGWIKSVAVANESDGIVLDVDYTPLGTQAVNEGWFAYHSPQWDMKVIGITKDGILCRPYRLRSGGLTNEPNIPVPPLVAANEEEPKTEVQPDSMLTKITSALKDAGLVKEGDGEDIVLEAIGRMISDLAWARQRKQEMAQEDIKLKILAEAAGANAADGTIPVLEAAAAKITTVTAAANEAAGMKALMERTVDFALDTCVSSGRITIAQRTGHRETLLQAANETELTAGLEALKTKPKTVFGNGALLSKDLAASKKDVHAANDADARGIQRQALVDEVLMEITKGKPAKPGQFNKAWGIAQQRQPELFKA